VTIELNALKLAENKTFADCANFIFTTIMGMCLPPPPQISAEYLSLYAKEQPDTSSNNGASRKPIHEPSCTRLLSVCLCNANHFWGIYFCLIVFVVL
jgi:hypothetical protein